MTAENGDKEFYAQLIPLEGDRVLLPAAAVQESVQMERVEVNTGSPAWLVGYHTVMGERLPVLSLEGLMGQSIPARSTRSRLVRILSLGQSGDWMMLAQGQPHMTPLNNTALQAAPLESKDPLDLVLSRARIANLSVFIPDLEVIEERLEKALKQAGGGELPDWQPGSTA